MENTNSDPEELSYPSLKLIEIFKKLLEDTDVENKDTKSIICNKEYIKRVRDIKEQIDKKNATADKSHAEKIDADDEKIIQLSKEFKEKFSKLRDNFEKWKDVREKLIEILSSSANKLERNIRIVSMIRIVTSAADIYGTILRKWGEPENSWANFAMEQASLFGFLSLFVEKLLAQRILKDVKKALKLDQELFKEIVKWFKQTEELDKAVKKIFPYGIDPDLTKKIAESASNESDECYNIFISVIASSEERNSRLLKDEKFLNKANTFANSEAGKLYNKLALNYDPILSHCLKSELNEDIQHLLKICQSGDPSMYVDGIRALASKVRMKVILNVMTIMSAVNNILLQNKLVEYDTLQELWEKTKAELEGIEEIICRLSPEM